MLSKKICIGTAFLLACLGVTPAASAQSTGTPGVIGQDDEMIRTITTAVPILTVSPDARSAGMGDAGVAISPDANTPHWNPAKLGFVQNDASVSLSFTPWLRNIINDMYLAYLSGYKKVGDNSAFSASLRYFDLGEIQFRDQNGNELQLFNPKEYTVDLAYGTRLTEYLSLGIGARYIRSNLSGNVSVGGTTTETKPGNSAAVDIGVFYTRDVVMGGNNYNLSFGGNISNIGAKISYTNAERRDYIPTNLRLGTAITSELDPYNKLTLALDFNKLLVPSPNEFGEVPDKGVIPGIFGSFTDAPDGFSEEAKEVNISTGLEYWYDNIFAARAGYFYENPMKGNRQYLTFGLGLRYQTFGVDAAYLVPTNTQTGGRNPLENTIRISLHLNIDKEEDGLISQ